MPEPPAPDELLRHDARRPVIASRGVAAARPSGTIGVVTQPDDASAPDWPGLHLARREAAARGSSSVGTQHVLLALISGRTDDGDRTVDALRVAGVTPSTVGAALQAITGIGGVRPVELPVDSVPTSPRVARILSEAAARTEPPCTPRDRDVLRAMLDSDDPSIGRLVVTYVGSAEDILAALDRLEESG